MTQYIIGALIIGFMAIPLRKKILEKRKIRKKELGIVNTYDRLVREYKLIIEQYDTINHKLIGLDRKNKKLLIIDHSDNNRQEVCVPLLQISNCKIVQVRNEAERCIKSIYLELLNKRNPTDKVRLSFYDEEQDKLRELPALARKALHWKNTVDVHKYPGNIYIESGYLL
ncbi:MAG: hypothetical protein ACJ748_13055 [Flavisolibacter sp.]